MYASFMLTLSLLYFLTSYFSSIFYYAFCSPYPNYAALLIVFILSSFTIHKKPETLM